MAEEISIRTIIEDWALSVWRTERPNSYSSRLEAYMRLFETLKNYGFNRDDWMLSHAKLTKDYTVGKKGTGKQLQEWGEAADKHILDAMNKVYGNRVKIVESVDIKKVAPKKVEKIEAEPKQPPKDYKPNDRVLDYIDKNFKFEGTDEDLE